jgi:hypothetical protein
VQAGPARDPTSRSFATRQRHPRRAERVITATLTPEREQTAFCLQDGLWRSGGSYRAD